MKKNILALSALVLGLGMINGSLCQAGDNGRDDTEECQNDEECNNDEEVNN